MYALSACAVGRTARLAALNPSPAPEAPWHAAHRLWYNAPASPMTLRRAESPDIAGSAGGRGEAAARGAVQGRLRIGDHAKDEVRRAAISNAGELGPDDPALPFQAVAAQAGQPLTQEPRRPLPAETG